MALGGSPIPLPNAQVLSPDITANTGNTVFTVVTLPANSTITLQLFTTIAGTAILVSGGAGASLTIIRLS